MTKKVLFGLFASLTLAFGQPQEHEINRFRADVVTAKIMAAAAAAIDIPDDQLPPIKSAAIVVAGGENGDVNRSVYITINNAQGGYFARGILSDGANTPIPIGAWYFDSPAALTGAQIIGGNPNQVFPNMGQVWKVELFHFYGGLTEKLLAISGPYANQASGLDVQVGSDQWVSGQYAISLGGDTSEITSVGVGPWGLAVQINQYPAGGAVAVFPQNFSLPGNGAASITICKKGWCYTDTFKSRVPGSIPGVGKG